MEEESVVPSPVVKTPYGIGPSYLLLTNSVSATEDIDVAVLQALAF
jgi:hypothetical protein